MQLSEVTLRCIRVEALGGRLEITSTRGEGTVLVAEIPTGATSP